MNTTKAGAVIAQLRELPALPTAVLELLRSLDDPELDMAVLAQKIAADQALAAKTLRLANSAFFGLSRCIETLTDAAAVVGLRSVRSIALSAGLSQAFQVTDCPSFDLAAFWRHSLACALCAEALAEALGQDAGQAFAHGLMHDIGRVALASALPQQYETLLQDWQHDDAWLLDCEQAQLGIQHAEVGAVLAEQWQLAPAMVAVIGRHHHPDDGERSLMLDLCHVADNIAHALDLSHSRAEMVPPLSMAAWHRLGLDETLLQRVFRQTEARHQALCRALMTPEAA